MPGSPRRRRWLTAALAVTAVVALADLSGLGWPSQLRYAAAAVAGPVVRAVGPAPDELSRERATSTRLAQDLREAREAATAGAAAERLLESPSVRGATLVLGRVVAVGSVRAAGPERVTLDIGSRDGIRVDQAVVSVDGLVGRTIAVSPWTCDVLVIGSPDLVVGVRVGDEGVLGVAGQRAGATPTRADHVPLSLVEQGRLSVGAAVSTLGSADGMPFVSGIPVGTVAEVNPGTGAVTGTGWLRPAVDVASLDVVGVILAAPRGTPRPAVTGGAP